MDTDQNANKKNKFRTILLILGILLLIVVVYLLKNKNVLLSKTASDAAVTSAALTPSSDADALETLPANETTEERYDRLIQAGKPIFMFFRSDSCEACVEMEGIVDQVFPEFEGKIEFLEVDVFDPQNNSLMKRAHIQAVPTLVFIDQTGQGSFAAGVMEAEQFQNQLPLLIESD